MTYPMKINGRIFNTPGLDIKFTRNRSGEEIPIVNDVRIQDTEDVIWPVILDIVIGGNARRYGYKMVIGGISFRDEWPESLCRVMLDLINHPGRSYRTRVKVWYDHGDTASGYLSTSSGPTKIVTILPNRNSTGGRPIWSKIVKITGSTKDGKVFWDFARDEPILWVMKQ